MMRFTAYLFAGLALVVTPFRAAADTLTSSVLGNSGEIYSVRAGSYGELFPGGTDVESDRPVLALDVLVPGEDLERRVVPATFGPEVESSPRLLYSERGDRLNVIWESQIENEASLLLARFEDGGWSAIEELYFHPEGTFPEKALTSDVFRLESGEGNLDLERQTLHLVWPRMEAGKLAAGYMPILFLNGDFIGWKEPLTFRHLNADANSVSRSELPPILKVRAHDDRDSVSLTFGSSNTGRVTSMEIGLAPMELVHLSDTVRDLVVDLGFDPEDIANFADRLGVHIVGVGTRGRARSRLTISVMDYVATGVVKRVLDTGGSYTADQADVLADDLRAYTLDLTRSLFAPASVATASSHARSRPVDDAPKASPILEIDVSDVVESSGAAGPSAHVVELRSAAEWSLPDSGGARITLFTSDDGLDLLAGWLDSSGESVWFVETNPDFTWSAPKVFALGEHVTLEEAAALLRHRVR